MKEMESLGGRSQLDESQLRFISDVHVWLSSGDRGYPEPPESWHPMLDGLLSKRSRQILQMLRDASERSDGRIVPTGAVAARMYELEAEAIYQERSRDEVVDRLHDFPGVCPKCFGKASKRENLSYACDEGCGWWVKCVDWDPNRQIELMADRIRSREREAEEDDEWVF